MRHDARRYRARRRRVLEQREVEYRDDNGPYGGEKGEPDAVAFSRAAIRPVEVVSRDEPCRNRKLDDTEEDEEPEDDWVSATNVGVEGHYERLQGVTRSSLLGTSTMAGLSWSLSWSLSWLVEEEG